MKKIAIIGFSDIKEVSNEFNNVCEQLIKHSNAKFLFYLYLSSSLFIECITRKIYWITSSKVVKAVKLPSTGKNVFTFVFALFNMDLLFIKGTTCALLFPLIRLISSKKIVFHIDHSDLNVNVRSKLTKFFLIEKIAFRYCHAIVTCSDSIKEYIAVNYGLNAELIEQGVNQIERIESTFADHKQYPFLRYMYAFCYFEEDNKKYTEVVLNAFKQTKHKYVVVIGDWNNSDYGFYLKNKFAGYSNIFMLHPFGNQRELNLVRSNAMWYIHSSATDNNSIELLEAMSLKLPVLAVESLNNKYLTEGKAAYFKNSADVNCYLDSMNIEKLRNNALALNDIALNRFDWLQLVPKYEKILEELILLNRTKVLLPSWRNTENAFVSFDTNDLKPRSSFLKTILNFFL